MQTKAQLESKTIIASIVGLTATILQMFNVGITPEEQNIIITGILGIVQLASFATAWYGRLKANTTIE